MAAAVFEGASIGPLVDLAIQIDYRYLFGWLNSIPWIELNLIIRESVYELFWCMWVYMNYFDDRFFEWVFEIVTSLKWLIFGGYWNSLRI